MRKNNYRLFGDLVFDPEFPAQFELVDELPIEDGREFAFARLYRIRSVSDP
jgi:hypothetical protein